MSFLQLRSRQLNTRPQATPLSPDPGVVTVTGTAAALLVGLTLSAGAGSYTAVAGVDAELYKSARVMSAESAAYTVSGTAATFRLGYNVVASADAYAIAGADTTLTYQTFQLAMSQTDMRRRGYPRAFHPSLAKPMRFSSVQAYTVAVDAGTYTWTGADATFPITRKITADAGAYAIAGTDATLNSQIQPPTMGLTDLRRKGFPRAFHPSLRKPMRFSAIVLAPSITAEAGTYSVAGTAATLTADTRSIVALDAVYAVVGSNATLTYSASETVTGLTVTDLRRKGFPRAFHPSLRKPVRFAEANYYTFACDSGAFSVTGTDALLGGQSPSRITQHFKDSYAWPRPFAPSPYGQLRSKRGVNRLSSVPAAATLDATSGTYTVSGTAATLRAGRVVSAVAGSYTWTGTAATLNKGRTLTPVEAGSYTISGTAAALKSGHVLAAAAGNYSVNGTAANTIAGYRVAAVSGPYSVTGADASIHEGNGVTADAGSYAVTGTAATLRITRTITASAGTYAWAGTAAVFTHITPDTELEIEGTVLINTLVPGNVQMKRNLSRTVRIT